LGLLIVVFKKSLAARLTAGYRHGSYAGFV
jgi:hypothetical protein